jgi:hypothetical protein
VQLSIRYSLFYQTPANVITWSALIQSDSFSLDRILAGFHSVPIQKINSLGKLVSKWNKPKQAKNKFLVLLMSAAC